MEILDTNNPSVAYHSLHFEDSLEALHGRNDSQSTELKVKNLLEMGQPQKAAALAEYVLEQGLAGSFQYWRGVALYLARSPKSHVLDCFYHSMNSKEPLAPLAQAFVHYSYRDLTRAHTTLEQAEFKHPEHDHIRLLMMVQILLESDQLNEAEAVMAQSVMVLRDYPSLLRTYWSEIMEVRLFRARGRFDLAQLFIERLMSRIDSATAPRLHRNLLEAKELIDKHSPEQFIMMPKEDQGIHSEMVSLAAANGLTRKPILNALFTHLYRSGSSGTSKEEIVEAVWKQPYSAEQHNERFYKAINRLRAMIGDDDKAPRFLTRQGERYVLQMS